MVQVQPESDGTEMRSASIRVSGESVSSVLEDVTTAGCPLCGSQKHAPLFRQNGYTLVQCEACDLSFIHPYPKNVKQHHEAVAEYDYAGMEVLHCARQYANERLFYDRYFEQIRRECAGASAILDVGCGCGHLLERFAEYPQLERVGIELNRERARFARRVAGCEVLEVPIEEFESARHFDVVTLINVLSHLPNIGQLFDRLRCLLTERGKAILKTGEVKRDVKRGAIFDWEFPDHLQFLGWRTMEHVSARYGLRIEKHLRVPLSSERFARSTWSMRGRSGLRNIMKREIARLPFALPLLERFYKTIHNDSISSSFIVLRPE